MNTLIIDSDTAERLQRIAEAEHRSVEAVLRSALDSYTASAERGEINPILVAGYEVWSPQISPESARELLTMLQEDKEKHG